LEIVTTCNFRYVEFVTGGGTGRHNAASRKFHDMEKLLPLSATPFQPAIKDRVADLRFFFLQDVVGRIVLEVQV
jgi:hypothetical protein